MAKFNVAQKQRRAAIADQKRAKHGDPLTRKLKQKKDEALSVSGKRKRKLFKKWRRDQKEALEKGLINMQDVQMASAHDDDDDDNDDDGTSKYASKQPPKTFHLKKSSKLKLWQLKKKEKKKRKSDKRAAEASTDAMEE